MRSRLLTLAVLGLLAFLLYRFGTAEDLAAVPPPSGGSLLPGLETRDVDFISLKFRTGAVIDLRRDGQGPWFIVFPTDELAQQEFVEVLLNNLALAKILPVEEQGADIEPEDVGLGRRAKSIVVGRGELRTTLLVGDRNPLGNGVFAQVQGQPHIGLATVNVDTMLESFRGQDYVDKHLLRGLVGTVDHIRVETPEGVLLDARRDGDRWSLTEPLEAEADGSRIVQLIGALRRIEQLYPPDIDPTPYELSQVGLPNADQVARSDWAESTMVELGAPGEALVRAFIQTGWQTANDEVFVARNDLAKILLIERNHLNLLRNDTDFFRERRVMPPVRERAKRVSIRKGQDVLLDIRRDKSGLWTFYAPDRLAGVGVDAQRVDGRSLLRDFLGGLDGLRVESFDEQPESEPDARVRVDWNWAGRDRTDTLSLFDISAGDGALGVVSGRPTEGLRLGPAVLDFLDPLLPDLLRSLAPIEVSRDDWAALEIHLPGRAEALRVFRPDSNTSWQGDDDKHRRFALGNDILRGTRGLAWQPRRGALAYPYQVIYRGFSGESLGTLGIRLPGHGDPRELLGQAVAIAHWSGVEHMELIVPAELLERFRELR
jgi:hypothetical protein